VNITASAVTSTVIPVPKASQAQIDRPPYQLKADTITLDSVSEEIQATGNAELHSPEGSFNAANIHFNTRTRSGYLDEVTGILDSFHFRAVRMSLDEKKVKRIQQASFTTCVYHPPHYQVLAHDLVLYPDQRFEAQKMSLEIAGHRLFTIPHIGGDLSGRTSSTINPTVTAGSDSIDGAYIGSSYTYPLAPNTNLALQGRIGTERLVRGEVALNHAFAMDQSAVQGVFSLVAANRIDAGSVLTSGSDTDQRYERLTYSRLPALLVALKPIPLAGSLHGAQLRLGAGTGRYAEQPTGVTEDRSQCWATLQSQPAVWGPVQLRGELGRQEAFYSTGTHGVTELVLALESRAKEDPYFNFSLVHAQQSGFTPFLFDRVIANDELYSDIEIPLGKGSPWRLGLWDRVDLPSGFQRDYSISAIYMQDCLGYALSYRAVERSIGVSVVINAFSNFHHGTGGIGFIQ